MTVTTRRERRQQQRQQQRRSSGGGGSRSGGLSQVWIIVGVVAVAVALILVARATGVFDAPSTSTSFDINDSRFDTGGQAIGEHRDEVSKFHVPTGQKVEFPSLPPTSGDHWSQTGVAPAPWGVKTSWLPFEVTTHNLEHGGIVILYGPDVTSDQVNTLRTYVRQLQAAGFPKIVLEPWPDMPKDSKVILTAWNWIMKLPGTDQISIVKFTKAHHASPESPEPTVP
jgi:hypothetical protein